MRSTPDRTGREVADVYANTRVSSGAPALLGIDLGTSSTKAVVLDLDGQVVSVASAAYDVHSDHPGWAETSPASWWSAVISASRQAIGTARRDLIAVGLSGQMHGLVLTTANGEPTRPAILHPDTRATHELVNYRALPIEALRRLANPLSPNMAGPMLLWVGKHAPAALAAARWALQPKDWLRWKLTGDVASEPSDASATLLYDVAADRWDLDIIDRLGLRADLFAPLLPSAGALAGHLGTAAADALGLRAGIPVAAGGGDTAVAAVGTGLVEPGQLQLSVGTGGQIITPLADPVAVPGVHLYRTATPHGWYAMGAVLNAGLALQWVRQLLNASWDEVYAAAGNPPAQTDPLFLPHLAGERTPYQDPTMRAAWTGLGLSHDRTSLLRAALEGVAFTLREALDALPRDAAAAGNIRLAGGGTADAAWRQMLADVLQRPLESQQITAASGRGAALLGGVAAGVLDWQQISTPLLGHTSGVILPDPTATAHYGPRREQFRHTVEQLRAGNQR